MLKYKKIKYIMIIIAISLFSSCGRKPTPAATPTPITIYLDPGYNIAAGAINQIKTNINTIFAGIGVTVTYVTTPFDPDTIGDHEFNIYNMSVSDLYPWMGKYYGNDEIRVSTEWLYATYGEGILTWAQQFRFIATGIAHEIGHHYLGTSHHISYDSSAPVPNIMYSACDQMDTYIINGGLPVFNSEDTAMIKYYLGLGSKP